MACEFIGWDGCGNPLCRDEKTEAIGLCWDVCGQLKADKGAGDHVEALTYWVQFKWGGAYRFALLRLCQSREKGWYVTLSGDDGWDGPVANDRIVDAVELIDVQTIGQKDDGNGTMFRILLDVGRTVHGPGGARRVRGFTHMGVYTRRYQGSG